MPRPPIDMDELEIAFASPEEMESYLNTETGEVVSFSDDDSVVYEEFEEEDEGPEEGKRERLAEWLATSGSCGEWQHENILAYYDFEVAPPGRFAEIPHHGSSDGYRLMCQFADTVEDRHLQDLLAVALDGRGAFRRFKDVLLGYPEERERWFAFEAEARQREIETWLHDVFEDWDDEEDGQDEDE